MDDRNESNRGHIVQVGQVHEVDTALPITVQKVIRVNLHFGDIEVFERFMNEIRFRNRFILSSGPKELVHELLKYIEMRKTVELREGETFYRARDHQFQLGEGRPERFAADKMGAPPAKDAPSGRLNPEGIPYLYLASEAATAVAEKRPWKGARLSVAPFRLVQDVRVADFCWREVSDAERSKRPPWEQRAEFIWGMVGSLFSLPHHGDDTLGYLPTQYLAEALKNAGFDGVRYDRSLREQGYNLVLFDGGQAQAAEQEIHQVKVRRVHYEYE